MAVKLATFFITLLVDIAVGVVVFFFMLLAMNGFSESDANYGIVAYILLAAVVSIAMSVGAFVLTRFLTHRNYRAVAAVSIAVPSFCMIGAVLKVGCAFVGIVVAEVVRVNF
jgi:hypothetical protein